ncbi:Formamidopyrimidine-DNA glycosylase [Verrucomicrobia bacterium]|nr:Formamidopyrimidine-DNA glycosylase [Verrucomicrobiota bacterium]
MPELPEVEILVRHLRPALQNKSIQEARVLRERVIRPTSLKKFRRSLRGARFVNLARRGKYLLFELHSPGPPGVLTVLGHLGMTGRMYVLPAEAPLPKHAAVVLGLGGENFIFEDTRYFGRLTLDTEPVDHLGPEPLEEEFALEPFVRALRSSRQAIKVRLLDQSLVAGVGNIYASEALFQAGVAPSLPAHRLTNGQIERLWRAIPAVLQQAIDCGSTVPLNYGGAAGPEGNGFFYFGRVAGASDYYEERLRVYDRAGKPCSRCGTIIKRRVQAARSTYYCPRCQRRS